MFSITTMASSISEMPMESDKPSMVITLRVKPMALIKAKVAMTETGKAVALIRVARQSCRKNMNDQMASRAP